MVIPLGSRGRWLLVAGLFLLIAGYVALAGKELAASYYASRPDLTSLERAVRLSPDNADYRHRLGRYFAFIASDPRSASANFQSATALNPHTARYWLDLASIQQVLGNGPAQREALDRALQAEPTSPEVAWEAANFFLIAGDMSRAFREFRVVIENNPPLAGLAMQSCWRASPDADVMLRDVIPPRQDSLIGFLTFLMTRKEVDGSIKTWDRLLQLHQKFEEHELFDYLRFLFASHRPDAAAATWEQTAPLLDLASYLPTPDNLIVNGDFSLNILNGGFDWTYVNQPGVHLQLDSSDFRQGNRSLSISFEGPGIASAGVQQLIAVHGLTSFEFTAYYKSASFQGAGGPEVVLRDAYSGEVLFRSDPLKDADFWKPVHGKLTTPANTNLLLLNIERFPVGSPIRGKLWLDNFELSPASTDISKDHL
jgi:tetratricopeptide (TPR) repeat protein